MPASLSFITPRPQRHVDMLPHVQLPPGYMHAMPRAEHIALSAGGDIGQSAGFQHDHVELMQSQIRAPYIHVPVPASHWPPSAGSAAGQN